MAFLHRRAAPPAPPRVEPPAEPLSEGPAGEPVRAPSGPGKVGAARVSAAQVSARAVLKSIGPTAARPAVRGVPVLPFSPRPSVAETMGGAPLPTDEFTAMMAGNDSAAADQGSDTDALAADPPADGAAESPACDGPSDQPSMSTSAAVTAMASASMAPAATMAADDCQSPATVQFTVSGMPADMEPAAPDHLAYPAASDAGPRLHGQSQPTSAELARVIHAWPGLPSHMQTAILAIVQAGERESRG